MERRAKIMTKPTQLLQITDKVLQDPILLRKLCDRIYQLMTDDLQNQRDRHPNYSFRRFR
jgi:hypothetical protein